MLKKAILPLGIIVVGTLFLFVLVINKPIPAVQPVEETSSVVKVAVTAAVPKSVRLPVTAQGTVMPKREIDLIAQVSGQIVKVEQNFVDGGFFAPSKVLIHIDDRDYQVALLNAQAELANAEYQLAEEEGLVRQAKREWRDLGNQKANDLFMRKPQLTAAQANLASAQGRVNAALLNIERTKIAVPFAGRVKQTQVNLGQYVRTGDRLATVYDSTSVEVRLPLTEKQASLIDLPLVPQKVSELPAVNIYGSVAGRAYTWPGVITRTDAFVDADSRLYYAVVEIKNPFNSASSQPPLLPGLFVKAEITGREIPGVIELPREALYKRDKVVVVEQDNKVSTREVSVLRKSKTRVWVSAELESDTLVTIEKQSLTPNGTVVDPLPRDNESSIATRPEVSTETKATIHLGE